MRINATLLLIISLSATPVFSQSPGNISANLRLWIKANAGTSCATNACAINSWSNQISITDVPASFTATGTAQPSYLNANLNYNPAVLFGSANNMVGPVNNGIIPYNTDVTNLTFIAVASSSFNEGTLFSDNFIYSTTGALDKGWQVGVGNNYATISPTAINSIDYRSEASGGGNTNFHQNTAANTLVNNTPYVIEVAKDYTVPGNTVFSKNLIGLTTTSGQSGTVTKTRIEKEGARSVIGTSLDGQASIWSPNFQGTISEMIVYNRLLSAIEKQKVHSYLGIKYSLTQDRIGIGNAYLNSGGTTIYPSGGNGSYWYDIIGIGQDNQSGLLQKQSKQQDDVTRVYISSLSGSNENVTNTGTFSTDNQFVVMGHNNTPIQNHGSAEFPSGLGIYGRIDREWKIANTGFDATFSLDIKINSTPVNPSSLRILIDTDGDFTNATMYNPTMSYAGGYLTVSGITTAMIPTNSIRYLTIVTLDPIIPLHIELLSFSASLIHPNLVKLDWKTNWELNSDYFVVESSSNGTEWEYVASQKAAYQSNSIIDYVDYDSDPEPGTTYYRLKKVKTNGTFSYSEIETINIVATGLLYPNTVVDRFVFVSDRDVEICEIYNQIGQSVTSEVDIVCLEDKVLEVHCSHLSNGIYYLFVDGKATKFIKQ